MTVEEKVSALRERCAGLDTDSYDGMAWAAQQVVAWAAALGLPVTVAWEQAPAWHPTLRRFAGAGTQPLLVVEVIA